MTTKINSERFGLTNKELSLILGALEKYEQVEEAMIFGSRATGNYHRGSDIDIAIRSENKADRTNLLSYLNNEVPIPYFFDVVNLQSGLSPTFLEEIHTNGKLIYRRSMPLGQ